MDSLQALFPLITVVAGALLIMLLEVIFKREDKTYLAFVSLISLLVCGYFAIQSWNKDLSYFNGHLVSRQRRPLVLPYPHHRYDVCHPHFDEIHYAPEHQSWRILRSVAPGSLRYAHHGLLAKIFW